MKSKIKYISDKEKNVFKEEIIAQIEEYRKAINQDKVLGSSIYYDLLIYAKYIIEKENLDYFKIINGQTDELIKLLKERYKGVPVKIDNLKEYKLYEILGKLAFNDYVIEIYKDRVLDAYLDPNKKYLMVNASIRTYIQYPNIDIICEDFEINNKDSYALCKYKMRDEIIGIERNYYSSWNNINLEEYDALIFINDNKAKYIEFSEFNRKHITRMKEVFMITNYSNISNYKSSNGISRLFTSVRELKNKIKSVYIDDEKAYITYIHKDEEDKINIKELSNIPDDKLKNIIDSDKEIENVSIYVTSQDIIENNYRIGFKTYNNKTDNKELLRLVDNNARMTKRIRELDDEISRQIDRMIVK